MIRFFKNVTLNVAARVILFFSAIGFSFFLIMTDVQAQNVGGSPASARQVYEMVFGPTSVTCPDNGAGTAAACTLKVMSGTVKYTCSDANGCDVTMAESANMDGRFVLIVNVSANTVNFADSAGVSEIAGAFAAGQYDSIKMVYVTDRWVEVSRSNN